MADNYLGEIMLFAGKFVPAGFLPCDGRLLNIREYTALYSLLGTKFGGDGRNTFGLPNLCGIVPVGMDSSDSDFQWGETGGEPTVTLIQNELPAHTHSATAVLTATQQVSTDNGNIVTPTSNCYLASGFYDAATDYDVEIYASQPPDIALAPNPVSASVTLQPTTGGGQPHDNIQPFLVMNFCMCTEGNYPSPPSS